MQTLHTLFNRNGRVLNRHIGKVYGYIPAIVTRVHDPKVQERYKQGYVEVFFPTLQLDPGCALLSPDELKNLEGQPDVYTAWARLVTPAAGAAAGVYHMPSVGDEVLCAFEQGDLHHPYVIGCLWNGKNTIPSPNTGCNTLGDLSSNGLAADGGKNELMFWRSRTGNCITICDTGGKESITFADRSGQSCIELKNDTITVQQVKKDIRAFAKQLARFDCTDFTVNAKKSITKKSNVHRVEAGENYSHGAKKEILHVTGRQEEWCDAKMNITAMKNISVSADDQLEIQSKGGNLSFKALKDLTIASSSKQIAVESKGAMTITGLQKLLVSSSQAMLVKSGGMMTIMCGMKLAFKGAEAQLNCGGGGGFSLFGAILNAIKGAGQMLVKGAVAAANAVRGAVVAGAKAIGRGIASVAGAVTRLAGAAAAAVTRAAKTVVAAAGRAAQAVGNAVTNVARAAVRTAQAVGQRVAQAAQTATNAVVAAGRAVAQTAQRAAQAVGQAVRTAAERAVQGVQNAARAVQQVANRAAETVRNAAEAAVQTARTAVETVGNAVRNAGERVAQGARDALDAAHRVANEVVREVRSAAERAVEGVQQVGQQVREGVGRLADAVGERVGQAVDTVREGVRQLGDGAQRAAQAAGHAVRNAGEAAAQGVERGAQVVADGIRSGTGGQPGGGQAGDANAPPAGAGGGGRRQWNPGAESTPSPRDPQSGGGLGRTRGATPPSQAGPNAPAEPNAPAPSQQAPPVLVEPKPSPRQRQDAINPGSVDRWGQPQPVAQHQLHQGRLR